MLRDTDDKSRELNREQKILGCEKIIEWILNRHHIYCEREDIKGELWVVAIRAVDCFDPTHNTKFSSYLIRCLTNALWTLNRDQWLKNSLLNQTEWFDGYAFTDEPVYEETLNIHKLFRSFFNNSRTIDILEKRFIYDFTYEDLSKIYKISKQRVHQIVSGALDKMRPWFYEHYQIENGRVVL